jgi:glycosyltransferase involved in cell wall biosynthesis
VRVALVHDYLTQYGGAERVLEALHQLYPEAPVFTSLTDLTALPESFASWTIHNSLLHRLPGANLHHRALLPLFPLAFRSFASALREFDVVIADSSAWAHGVVVRDDALLICYCHSPARFLYGDQGYLGPARLPPVAKHAATPVLAGLRRVDQLNAARVDRYLANSRNVARRIVVAYGREARVVYPPVAIERYRHDGDGRIAEPWYLVVSRLVPHKRVDLVVVACNRLGAQLKVIGDGRAAGRLRALAGSTVEFLGRQNDDAVADNLQRCRALVLPAAEDFGMTAVEAQAAGRPVIAFGGGGALESVVAGETGLFFDQPTADSLATAIGEFERRSWDPARARANAERFSLERFHREIAEEVAAAIAESRLRSGGRTVGAKRR